MSLVRLTLTVMALLFSSCATLELSERGQRLKQIHGGESKRQVFSILGAPVETRKVDDYTVWVYSEDVYSNDNIYCQDLEFSFDAKTETLLSWDWRGDSINRRCSGYADAVAASHQRASEGFGKAFETMGNAFKSRKTKSTCKPTYEGYECESE